MDRFLKQIRARWGARILSVGLVIVLAAACGGENTQSGVDVTATEVQNLGPVESLESLNGRSLAGTSYFEIRYTINNRAPFTLSQRQVELAVPRCVGSFREQDEAAADRSDVPPVSLESDERATGVYIDVWYQCDELVYFDSAPSGLVGRPVARVIKIP